jgi:hypothetical protein
VTTLLDAKTRSNDTGEETREQPRMLEHLDLESIDAFTGKSREGVVGKERGEAE